MSPTQSAESNVVIHNGHAFICFDTYEHRSDKVLLMTHSEIPVSITQEQTGDPYGLETPGSWPDESALKLDCASIDKVVQSVTGFLGDTVDYETKQFAAFRQQHSRVSLNHSGGLVSLRMAGNGEIPGEALRLGGEATDEQSFQANLREWLASEVDPASQLEIHLRRNYAWDDDESWTPKARVPGHWNIHLSNRYNRFYSSWSKDQAPDAVVTVSITPSAEGTAGAEKLQSWRLARLMTQVGVVVENQQRAIRLLEEASEAHVDGQESDGGDGPALSGSDTWSDLGDKGETVELDLEEPHGQDN
ncbi:hypothetical protein JCM24511_01189 [Saitozyma sp. JCM 24511]|nr:hypothetical protein JCM24511_01189 [Saitozyma sp. JCM 24511]